MDENEIDLKRIVMLIKYSDDRKHLEELQKGHLYMNTLKYYRNLEKGMGDSSEGKTVVNKVDFKIVHMPTHRVFFGKGERGEIDREEDAMKHIFCTSYIEYRDLKVIKKENYHVDANIKFTEEHKQEVRKNFGKYALIIGYAPFVNNLNDYFKKDNIDNGNGKVKYDDFSTNNLKRLAPHFLNLPDKYLWKDFYFENQKEFRITILNRDSINPVKIKVGDMSKYTRLMTTKELFDDNFVIMPYFKPRSEELVLNINK